MFSSRMQHVGDTIKVKFKCSHIFVKLSQTILPNTYGNKYINCVYEIAKSVTELFTKLRK